MMLQLGAKWYQDPDHELHDDARYRNEEPDAPLLFVG